MKKTSILVLFIVAQACSEGPQVEGDWGAGQDDMLVFDGGGVVVPGTWVTIQPGSFSMGSPNGEACRDADEVQHQVTLTKSFSISDK
ncbi:MAG: hypothetical protein V1754_12225, partial [Pseudomonadota bacterium]